MESRAVKVPFTMGQLLYAGAVMSLGLVHLIAANFPAGLLPVPASLPGRPAAVIGLGIGLTGLGLGLLTRRNMYAAALSLGALWLLIALTLHLPALIENPRNGGAWTACFELVALGAGAFYLAGESAQQPDGVRPGRLNLIAIGRFLFAASLLVFALLHFVYASFIATLIPGWIPGHLYWAYLVGVAFAATTVSLLIRRQVFLAGHLLALLFFLWVIGLHAPRVVANPQIEAEWTSLLIALAMGSIGLITSHAVKQEKQKRAVLT